MNTFYTILQKHLKSPNTFLPGTPQFWVNVYKHELSNANANANANANTNNPNNVKFMIYYMINQMHYKLKSPYCIKRTKACLLHIV